MRLKRRKLGYVVRELEEKKKLRKFMKIKSVPSEDEVYGIMSSFDPDQFIDFIVGLLNNVCSRRKRSFSQIIIDSTDIDLDLNGLRGRLAKRFWKIETLSGDTLSIEVI